MLGAVGDGLFFRHISSKSEENLIAMFGEDVYPTYFEISEIIQQSECRHGAWVSYNTYPHSSFKNKRGIREYHVYTDGGGTNSGGMIAIGWYKEDEHFVFFAYPRSGDYSGNDPKIRRRSRFIDNHLHHNSKQLQWHREYLRR